jgi:hypothetical protein
LDCQSYPKSKVCLLQFITIKDGVFFTTRKQLKYIISDQQAEDFIDKVRKLLGTQNQQTNNRISYIEADYQLFSFILPGFDKVLNFYTKTMKFSWKDENKEIDNLTINENENGGQLMIDGVTFPHSNGFQITKLTLNKALILIEECPSIDGNYNYYKLERFEKSTKQKDSNPLPLRARLI